MNKIVVYIKSNKIMCILLAISLAIALAYGLSFNLCEWFEGAGNLFSLFALLSIVYIVCFSFHVAFAYKPKNNSESTLDKACDMDTLGIPKSKYKFENLTPRNDVELDIYEDALNYIFHNPDVRNIALSGAYSAGKSSILASYKKKYGQIKFLHISLAHFESPIDEKNKSNAGETDDTPMIIDLSSVLDKSVMSNIKESVLEGKILNQLIHQIPSERIPQTNFRVKKRVFPKNIIKYTVLVMALTIASLFFCFFESWKNYVNTLPENNLKTALGVSTHQYALIIAGIIIACISANFIYELICTQENKNIFRKLSVQGNEIEIFEESEDSFFDKYLNEVLYLFENVDANVIVFEDMDRFNGNRIFERLREVNTLVNIQLRKENKQPLRFLYLLRDDMFVSKDRTKFFDYIIPVVPVIDGSNSYDKFVELFKQTDLKRIPDEMFLQGLSLYIDDMRLLKNIYNEFLLYYHRLNTTELDPNKMMAIIAYKNLFPRDFADLQLNKGFVYCMFSQKDKLVERQIEALNCEIKQIEEKIDLAQKEHLASKNELDIIYDGKAGKDYYGNKKPLPSDLATEYEKRKEALKNREEGQLCKLMDGKTELESQLLLIKSKHLCEIITRENINAIFSISYTNEIGMVNAYDEIKSSDYFDLLKYLIRNGYIDETYADYMTFFYENSLHRDDKIFLRSVTDKKAKEYSYKLRNPQMVVARLNEADFDQEETLNFDLFTYVLKETSCSDQLNRSITQLQKAQNYKFIGAYMNVTTEMPLFVEKLNRIWPEMFSSVLANKSLNDKQIRILSLNTLYYSDDGTVGKVNVNDCLRDYISESRDYLDIDNPVVEKLVHAFMLIGVCFVGIDYGNCNKELFNAIYEHSLYEINSENLQLIMCEFLKMDNREDILHKNYSLLSEHPNSPIAQYVNQNIEYYFSIILDMAGESITDNEDVVIGVLNNDSISEDQKHRYISILKTSISRLSDINDSSLWMVLLDSQCISFSENNVLDYYTTIKKMDDHIVRYMNRLSEQPDFSNADYNNEDKKVLFTAIVKCDKLLNDVYEKVLLSFAFSYDDFSISNIAGDKVDILIELGIIRMTSTTLNFMRENYPNQLQHFIRNNIEKYVEIMDEDLFSHEELLIILDWDVRDDLKLSLLEFANSKISIIGKKYSAAVCMYILKNHLLSSDLDHLFKEYEHYEDPVLSEIFDLAIRSITKIIDESDSVSKLLMGALLETDRLDKDSKVDLFVSMLPKLSESEISDILGVLGLLEYQKIFEPSRRPRFVMDDESEKILDAFQNCKLISSYEEDPVKEGYYKIIRIKKPSEYWNSRRPQ